MKEVRKVKLTWNLSFYFILLGVGKTLTSALIFWFDFEQKGRGD